MIISNREQLNELQQKVKNHIEKTYKSIQDILATDDVSMALFKLKFDKIAVDPISGEECNFIEALNQTFSDFVVVRATAMLLDKYKNKEFDLHMGAINGFDIVSTDKTIFAECFAVTNINSNQKLKKDAKKLMDTVGDAEKYIFLYSREDTESQLESVAKQYSAKGITIVPIKELTIDIERKSI